MAGFRDAVNKVLNYHVQGYKPASQTMGLLSPLPVVGDASGLLADAAGYAQDPSTLTPTSGLLSLAAVVPGIPRPRTLRGAWKAFSSDESRMTAQDLLQFVRKMDSPPEDLLHAANRYESALKTDMEWAGRWDVGPEEDLFLDAVRRSTQAAGSAAKGKTKFRQIVEADLRRAVERGYTGRAEVLRKQLAEMDRLGE